MRIRIERPWLGVAGKTEVRGGPGQPLHQAVWLSGRVEPVPLCGGIGRCGRCRVRFLSPAPQPADEEVQVLGEQAVAAGWRLACRCQISDDDRDVTIELAQPPAVISSRCIQHEDGEGPAVLAMDLGTTSIAWRLLHCADGRILSSGSDLNPQAGAGADIISRVALAMKPAGAARLAGVVRDYARACLAGREGSVREIVLAGNTAMTGIFAGADVSGLAAAPYAFAFRGDEELSIPGLPPVYVPPLPAPFAGGDVSAGLAWMEAEGTPRPYLLVDLGTNGEIALLDEGEKLYLTSVPLGPALEGIGLECGAMAGPQTLTHFSIGPVGLDIRTATGRPPLPGQPVQGISATGFLSLIELLLSSGLMNDDGHFREWNGRGTPLVRRLVAAMDWSLPVPRFMATRTLWLSLSDVEEILKVKAAFSVAVQDLMKAAGVKPQRLACLAVAGSLGTHVQPRTLERLGFVPAGTSERVRMVGNTSLAGACLLALHPEKRHQLAQLCRRAVLLEPALDPDFHERYLQAMRFSHLLSDTV